MGWAVTSGTDQSLRRSVSPERTHRGWALDDGNKGAARDIKNALQAFCRADLLCAFPEDPERRASSLNFLMKMQEVLGSDDPERASERAQFERTYVCFDTAARPFYGAVSFALGGTFNDEVVARTNQAIDPIVESGAAALESGRDWGGVFEGMLGDLVVRRLGILGHDAGRGTTIALPRQG